MSRTLILGAEVFDTQNRCFTPQDIYIEAGVVTGLDNAPAGFHAEKTLDAKGCLVTAGWVDTWARLREPGFTHKGGIASESYAAACAGVTSLIVPPDTSPIVDKTATVELIKHRAQSAGFAKVFPLSALTHGLEGKEVANLAALREAGCIGASNADQPIVDLMAMRRVMEYAASFNITLVLQPSEPSLSQGTCAHEGLIAHRMGLQAQPASAESVAIAQIIELSVLSGARVHLSRLTSRRGVELVRQAKASGLPITADVSINHLHLTEQHIEGFDAQCHLWPPLRSEDDRQALIAGLMDDTLDAICSDHAPHEPDAKLSPFPTTEPGASSVELLLPLVLYLAERESLPLTHLIPKVTSQPSQIFALKGGEIGVGGAADLVVIDPKAAFTVSASHLKSKGKNTPYMGCQLLGQAKHTLLDGRIID